MGVLQPGPAKILQVEVVLEPPGFEQGEASTKHQLVVKQGIRLLVFR
jgi:hypothetical protein